MSTISPPPSSVMMASVLKHTKNPVKFWFLKNYLSPKFIQSGTLLAIAIVKILKRTYNSFSLPSGPPIAIRVKIDIIEILNAHHLFSQCLQ